MARTPIRKGKGLVLAEGEHTGHFHLVEEVVKASYRDNETLEFTTKTAQQLVHQEHQPVAITAGEWCSGIVQEFDHLEQQLRTVRD